MASSRDLSTHSIHKAAALGDTNEVMRLIAAKSELLNAELYQAKEGFVGCISPVGRAAINGHANLVKLLVEKGAVIDRRIIKSCKLSKEVMTALKGVRYKVGEWPPIDPKSKYRSYSPGIKREIEKAWDSSDTSMIQAWIDHDPYCVNRGDKVFDKPISTAIFGGSVEALRLLLENDAELPPEALEWVTSNYKDSKSLNKMKVLVEFGAGKNPETNAKALEHILQKSKSLEAVELLLSLEINWNHLSEEGQPLIHVAFAHFPTALPYMKKAGANIDQINNQGLTLMHLIAGDVSNSALQKLEILFNCDANPTVREPQSHRTPYQFAYCAHNFINAQRIADYMTRFQGQIAPSDTIEAQLEELKPKQKGNRSEVDEDKLLARLAELEGNERKLRAEKAKLLEELSQQPVSVGAYDRQDYGTIKPMLDFFTDKLAEFPALAPELLRKVAVSSLKTAEDIHGIIKAAFAGNTITEDDFEELVTDLIEINAIALKDRKQLKLKSKVEYKAVDIANMICDAAKDNVLEKQRIAAKANVAPPAPQSAVAVLQRTSSPLHHPPAVNADACADTRDSDLLEFKFL